MNLKVENKKDKYLLFIICTIGLIINGIKFKNINQVMPIENLSLFLLGIIISFILIELLSKKLTNERVIYSDKKAIIPFSIEYIILYLVIYFISYKFYGNNLKLSYGLLIQIFLISSLFILLLVFKINIKNFYWNIKFEQLIIIIVIALVIFIPTIICGKYSFRYVKFGNIVSYIVKILLTFIYPSMYEEVLYRGMLISGLKTYGLANDKINIVQAVLFGVMHFNLYSNCGLYSILSTGMQILLGYILGRIYFKTKSLSLCVIFHTLLDII